MKRSSVTISSVSCDDGDYRDVSVMVGRLSASAVPMISKPGFKS